ncbi:c-type cytochrome [Stieleria sp. ICT_E10.1]|uniref:PVC-type heme-binding CxxCH protein n=1 Tax=Stieleria sedimenti TaxID=2976331 RepID=UPI00217FC68B|nr:PVC-type heme-binding CxxCH protein [Stieleria sedimenti]MCS7471155.1 c-type cytochrome [Stieleria sedimenti]
MRFVVLMMAVWGTAFPSIRHAAAQTTSTDSPAGNEKVAEIFRTFSAKGAQRDASQLTPPDQMIDRLRLRSDVEADLIAHEPELSQPLFLSWDSRGRMWAVQYRQYQYPAGLKVERFDQYLRAVYDKVPEPPPHGAAGADKITVFSDTDGDGLYDSSKDVITGLNVATSVQVGPKGIWVLNPPYLLHYPDADGDDVPDGDPEVHLSGFGLQDTHSVANSLLWGPDGWLYGANGSTTAGTVSSQVTKGVRFEGQCIWRYHPESKVFEIYAEGGGNTFSLEIDSYGQVFSGTNGGSRRGYHYPQGSYSDKNWGKHGPLINPYAFGYFTGMPMKGDTRRFAQAFMIYEGGLFSNDFDRSIVAPNSLHNLVWNSRLIPDGSTYRTEDVENLIETDDRWFRPVYAGAGPDGAIYIADWYDTRLSHVNPVDDWHKNSGRIYRIRPKGSTPVYRFGDLTVLSSDDLIKLFDSPNKWLRRRAALVLGWRNDSDATETLVKLVDQSGSLESLWTLNLMGQLSTERAAGWLRHDNPHIRRWTVRLLGDRHEGHQQLVSLAENEPNLQVRAQLASTAKRIDSQTGLAIIDRLTRRDEDGNDPHLPLLYWWAVEAHADDWDVVNAFFSDDTSWDRPLVRQHILGRLAQRYAAAGTAADMDHCDNLVALAPDDATRDILLVGLTKAFQGRSIPELPKRLDRALSAYQESRGESGAVLALRSGREGAADAAIKLLRDASTDLGLRIELAYTLGELREPKSVDALLRLATGRETSEPALQRVAISTLANFDDARIAAGLIGAFYGKISREHGLRAAACRTLASRAAWADRLLEEVIQWRVRVPEVPEDVIQRLRTYEDPAFIARVEQAFGKAVTVSSAEKVAEIERLTELLSHSAGDPEAGKKHFMTKCGTCHKLFGEGKTIGPPLDGYERGSLKFWLPAIIEPSLEIREGFQSYMALTLDGRVATGMMAAQDPKTVTLRTADDQTVVLVRDDLEEFKAIKTSLMPEQVFKDMTDQQIIDLFAYLMLGTRR